MKNGVVAIATPNSFEHGPFFTSHFFAINAATKESLNNAP
jgi:hypothetical protein